MATMSEDFPGGEEAIAASARERGRGPVVIVSPPSPLPADAGDEPTWLFMQPGHGSAVPSRRGHGRASHARTGRCHAGTERCHAGTERCHAGTERCHAGTER
jgi:hypothetical protein